jgi:signal transduction histidine kinase
VKIAAAWLAATSDIAYIPYPMPILRQRLERMTTDALDALQTTAPMEQVVGRGRAIGREIVELNLIEAEALERTLTCLGEELAGVADAGRLAQLLAGIAGGFAGAAEAAILGQQEAIRRAATIALERTHADLAAVNEQLSAEIAERIQAERTQRDLADRLLRLHEIDLAILSAKSLPDIAAVCVDHVRELIPSVIVSLTLFDHQNERAVILHSSHPAFPAGRVLPIYMKTGVEALARRLSVDILDLRQMPNPSPGVVETIRLGGRALLSVPIRWRDELLGTMVIVLAEVRAFTNNEKAIVTEIADSAAIAILNRQLLEAEQAARERETTLREVAASLSMGLDLDDLLHRILTQLDRVIAGDSSAVMLLDGERLRVPVQRGRLSTPRQIEAMLAHRPRSIWQVIESSQPFIINDTQTSPDWITTQGFEKVSSWLGVPLLLKGDCMGLITIDREAPNSFNEQDKALAMAFASQAAIAIENARLFARRQEYAGQLEQRVRERTRELEVLYGITAAAVGNPDLASLMRRSLELTVAAFDCAAAAIHLIEGEEIGLRPAALVGRAESAEMLGRLAANDPLLLRPLQTGAPLILNGADLPPDWGQAPNLCLAVAPLRSAERSLGVFSMVCDSPRHMTDDGLLLLTTIVDQIGTAIENIRLRQITRQTAIIEERERLSREIHDAVTQTIYAIALFADAAREAARAGRPAKAQQNIEAILELVEQALRELRLLMFELRPESLSRLGLVEALRERLRMVEHRFAIAADVYAANVGELPYPVEGVFYRIALEALNNSLRHARARRIDINLAIKDDQLEMTIVDDGIGFEGAESAGGMGLNGMQERIGQVGGELILISRGGGGTKVTARAPSPTGRAPVG